MPPRAEPGDAVSHYAERFRDTVRDLGESVEDDGQQLSEWLRTTRGASD